MATPYNRKVMKEFEKVLPVIVAQFGVDWIIAGGAVRDYLNDVPIRDVDIFVHWDQLKKIDSAAFQHKFLCFGYRTTFPKVNNEYLNDEVETTVIKLTPKFPLAARPEYVPNIDLIFRNIEPITRCVDNFPCDISKVFWSPTQRFGYTYGYHNDTTNKKLTFTEDAKPEYIKKISLKYPTHTHRTMGE